MDSSFIEAFTSISNAMIANAPGLGGVSVGLGVGSGIGANTVVMPGNGAVNSGIGLDAGVRAGANATADERAAATGANGSAGAGAQAGGRWLGCLRYSQCSRPRSRGVRDTGRAMGRTAVQTGKRVKGAAQANADARLQSELIRAN